MVTPRLPVRAPRIYPDNPHVRICGGPGSATTLVYPTASRRHRRLAAAEIRRCQRFSDPPRMRERCLTKPLDLGRHKSPPSIFRVYPGFPTLFWGLSGFFVNDLMGKALWSSWKTRSVFQGAVGAFCASTAPSASTGPSVCDKIAASSDCSRPVNDYVHIEAADLRRPNARFTTERQGYQVLTPFGKLGYSQFFLRLVLLF